MNKRQKTFFVSGIVIISVLTSYSNPGTSTFSSIPPEIRTLELSTGSYKYVAGELLVLAGQGADINDVMTLLSGYSAEILNSDAFTKNRHSVVKFPSSSDIIQIQSELKTNPLIKAASLNYVGTFHTLDEYFDEQWPLRKIKAQEGWDNYTTGDPSVIVAILDSGYTSHEELDEDNPRVIADDIYNLTGGPHWEEYRDLQDHAMGVAGIVAAQTNNDVGIAGTAWDIKLWFIKVGTSYNVGFVDVNWLTAGIDMVVDAAIANPDNRYIINASLGVHFPPEDRAILEPAVARADSHNVLIVASAGNTVELGPRDNFGVEYPAMFSRESVAQHYCNVISVGAVDSLFLWADYSNYLGPGSCAVYVDISAPGGTRVGENALRIVTLSSDPFNPYKYSFGTSYSAAYVSGAAALVWSMNPLYNHLDVKNILKSTAYDPSDPDGWSYSTMPRWCYLPQQPSSQLQPICEDECNPYEYNRKKGTGILNIYEALQLTKPSIHGAIYNDISLSGEVFINGDLIIPEGKTLTIDPGCTVYLLSGDVDKTGEDPDKIEILVYGTIIVNGEENDPCLFMPLQPGPDPGYWTGIRIYGESAVASFLNCQITHAYHGIKTYYPIQMSNSTITDCEVHGLYVQGNSAQGMSISQCAMNDNGSAGIMIAECDDIDVDTCSVNGNYHGLWISNARVDVLRTEMKNNTGQGVKLSIVSSGILPSKFDWCEIESNGQHGMYFCESANLSGRIRVSDTRVKLNGASGIYCTGSYTNPEISSSKICDNLTGVQVAYSAKPVLGQFIDGGDNSLYDQVSYDIYGSLYYTISAENCWWGTAPGQFPDPDKFKGLVDYHPYLESDPVIYLFPGSNRQTQILSLAQNYPNPITDGRSTAISYYLPERDSHVALKVYDVAGRQVRTLLDKPQGPGSFVVTWDGRNESGKKVATGIYFCQLVAGNKTISRKIILLR